QLVGVPMLLVVVDQARVRRRCQHAVEAAELLLANVSMDDGRGPPSRTQMCELPQPGKRVERVAAQELSGRLDRPALAPVLVAPVRLELRLAREVEIEVGSAPRRAGGARQHDA